MQKVWRLSGRCSPARNTLCVCVCVCVCVTIVRSHALNLIVPKYEHIYNLHKKEANYELQIKYVVLR
jgi:hypothetical protein